MIDKHEKRESQKKIIMWQVLKSFRNT
jgi:hypothetical protein